MTPSLPRTNPNILWQILFDDISFQSLDYGEIGERGDWLTTHMFPTSNSMSGSAKSGVLLFSYS